MTTTIIATKNAPDAIGPYVQGVDMGSFVLHPARYRCARRRAPWRRILNLKRYSLCEM